MLPEKTETKKFSVTLPENMYETLNKLAKQKHISQSELIRSCLSRCLTIEWAESSENIIRRIMREEIDEVMAHQTERLIKLQVKAAKAAISALYLNVLLIQSDYADEVTTEDLVASAFKHAAGYLRLKEEPIENYAKEAREFIIASSKIKKKDDR